MVYNINFEPIAWLLEESGYKKNAEIFRKLNKIYSQNSEAIESLYSYSGGRSVQEIVLSLLEERRIGEKTLKELQNIQEELQGELLEKYSIPATEYTLQVLDAFDIFGVIYFDRKQDKITFFIHPRFSLAMFRYFTFMNHNSSEKHIQQIWQLRNPNKELNKNIKCSLKDKLNNAVLPLQENISKFLTQHIKKELYMIFKDTPISSQMRVEFLPTSTDFYLAGIEYYKTKVGRRRFYDIFSTTSGIILPEEHYGSKYFVEKLKRPDIFQSLLKNEIREKYFKTLIQASWLKPRVYYFEKDRSKKQFNSIVSKLSKKERIIYEKDAWGILKKFLNKDNFGLIRVSQFPKEFDYLTLGSGSSVLISGRTKGKISHGFWVRPLKRNVLKEVFEELDLEKMWQDIFGILASYFTGKELGKIFLDFRWQFWSAFAGPLMYILLKLGLKTKKNLKDIFVNLGDNIQLLQDQLDIEIVKSPKSSKSVKEIREIYDVFDK